MFSAVFASSEDKVKQLIRVIRGLNVAYGVDDEAFRQIVRGRTIADAFDVVDDGRAIYAEAREVVGDEPHLLQQEGNFELYHRHGNVERAEYLFLAAESLAPHDKSIQHSIANLFRRKALQEDNDLLREEYRRRAKGRLADIQQGGKRGAFELNTQLNLMIDELKEILSVSNSERTKEERRVLFDKIREIEKLFNTANMTFASDEHLLATEAVYRTAMNEHPKAIAALSSAFTSNPTQDWIGIRLADLYSSGGDEARAKEILQKVVAKNPGSRRAHLKVGLLLSKSTNEADRGFGIAAF